MIKDGRFALVKTTLLDYPGKVAAAVFLPGCHLRCPYCHNPELVDMNLDPAGTSFNADMDEFRTFLHRRAHLLGGVAFSGGEALLHPLLPELISETEKYNLPVKLDTAGLLPETLAPYLKANRLNYISMDLKTLPERYPELGWAGSGDQSAESLLRRTVRLLAESEAAWEIRTTVVPPLVDETVLRRLAGLTAPAPRWVLQEYRRGGTLDPRWSSLQAPDESALIEIAERIESISEIVIR